MSARKKLPAPLELFNKNHIESIRKALVGARQTIAVAESVTAGMLQLALASAENASQFFQGGLTAYNIGQKTLQLNVEPIEALASNCVSEVITKEMARNVCIRFRSHWGVAVTGYATPVPESSGKIFAWFAISRMDKVIHSSRIDGQQGSTLEVQLEFTAKILERLATEVGQGLKAAIR
jgi:nicotinamide-nucleotide amidase